ncbi:MAG: DUF4358 domain-containing protein [Eubacterium sp.]|nr:DUF4358 domain-containing protein [Eubacterium sp.]
MKWIKKIVCLMTVAALALTGCGDSGEGGSNVDVSALGGELSALDTELPSMETVTNTSENAETAFAVLADYDYAKIDSFYYAYSASGSPEEIAVISVKEKNDVADLMKALQNHLDSRRQTFQAYDPDQVSMVDNAIITYQGKVLLYACSKKNGVMQDKFKEKVAA